MASTTPRALGREGALILGLLLVLAALAWVFVASQAGMSDGMGGLTMGMGPALFLGIWVAMMVAMMFPTAAPMVLMFARVGATRRSRGDVFVPTWVFVGAYLIVWTAAGAVAFGLAVAAEQLAQSSEWITMNAARLGGGVIVLAGLYQLSPFKDACLSRCRSPLSFVMNGWREGYWGAVRMGLSHGLYCLGCCWMLFVLLFPLGVMNVAAMAVITVLILAEKASPIGRRVSLAAGVVLIVFGALVIAAPSLLPTTMPGSAMDGM